MKLTSIVERDLDSFRGNFKVDPEERRSFKKTRIKSDFTRWHYPTIEILIILKMFTNENASDQIGILIRRIE